MVNYSDKIKPPDWPCLINSTKYWGKPILLVINRAFLTYNNKYEKLKNDLLSLELYYPLLNSLN